MMLFSPPPLLLPPPPPNSRAAGRTGINPLRLARRLVAAARTPGAGLSPAAYWQRAQGGGAVRGATSSRRGP